MKKISLIALAAIASVFATNAMAADLGGNCCADLEERIAELEATAARKGNRKVKLTVSGQVNEAVMFWDDGEESNIYQVTNEVSRTRFRFVGDAKIDATWSAGYLLEIGVRGANQNGVSQNTDDAGAGLDIRHSAWWINHKDLGKLWVGQTSTASDGITEIDLAGRGHFLSPHLTDFMGGFLVRNNNGTLSNVPYATVASSNAPGSPGEGNRNNVVKYETPTIQGFTGSAAFGEDDMWDIALRYANEFNGVKVAFGVAYQQWTDNNYGCANIDPVSTGVDCDALGLSGSVMHVATGLFATGAYGYRKDDNRQALFGANVDSRDEFFWLSAGISQKWFPAGKSTIYGEYGEYENGAGLTTGGLIQNGATLQGGAARIASRDISIWGVGFNQSIDAAAMDVYVMYRNIEADIFTSATGVKAGSTKAATEDFQTVVTGAIIRF